MQLPFNINYVLQSKNKEMRRALFGERDKTTDCDKMSFIRPNAHAQFPMVLMQDLSSRKSDNATGNNAHNTLQLYCSVSLTLYSAKRWRPTDLWFHENQNLKYHHSLVTLVHFAAFSDWEPPTLTWRENVTCFVFTWCLEVLKTHWNKSV